MKRKSAVMQMYEGERGQYENFKQTKQEQKLLKKLIAVDTVLEEKLKENNELFQLYTDAKKALESVWSAISDSHYAEGFKFGFLMGMEIAEEN